MQPSPIIWLPIIHGLFVIIGAMVYSIATTKSPSSQFNLPDAFLRVLAGIPTSICTRAAQLARTIKLQR